VALKPVVQGPGYESPNYGDVTYLDASVILGEDVLHCFLVNRNLENATPVEIHHPGGQLTGLASAEMVTGLHPETCNIFEQPDLITSRPFRAVNIQDGIARVELPPLSVVAMTFQTA
jgi:alpha-L-arabinofuranosidase